LVKRILKATAETSPELAATTQYVFLLQDTSTNAVTSAVVQIRNEDLADEQGLIDALCVIDSTVDICPET